MPKPATWTTAQCTEALHRAEARRDTQAIAAWRQRLRAARTEELRAYKRASKKRRAA